MSDVMNSFHPSIVCTHDVSDGGKSASFLDLALNLDGNHLHYSTYRKPINVYNYTPYDSCHARNIFRAIIATELFRLLRTNNSEASFDYQVAFFFGKLVNKGYAVHEMRRLALKFCWSRRDELLQRSSVAKAPALPVVPFKIHFVPGLQGLRLSRIVNQYKHLLCPALRNEFRFLDVYTSRPNLFRQRFYRFRTIC